MWISMFPSDSMILAGFGRISGYLFRYPLRVSGMDFKSSGHRAGPLCACYSNAVSSPYEMVDRASHGDKTAIELFWPRSGAGTLSCDGVWMMIIESRIERYDWLQPSCWPLNGRTPMGAQVSEQAASLLHSRVRPDAGRLWVAANRLKAEGGSKWTRESCSAMNATQHFACFAVRSQRHANTLFRGYCSTTPSRQTCPSCRHATIATTASRGMRNT